MSSRRLMAPALLVLSLMTTAGGVVTAVDLRADEQRLRERAQERREIADWLAALRPIAEQVYDHAQPLQKALEDTTGPAQLYVDVLEDVSQELVDSDALGASADLLEQSGGPRAVAADKDALVAAVRKMAGAAVTASTAFEAEGDAYVDALVTSDLDLDSATRAWRAALVRIHDGRPLPPTLDTIGTDDPARAPSSRAAYLHVAGAVCARSLEAVVAQEEPDTLDERRQTAAAAAAALRADLPALVAVAAPAADADLVRDSIVSPLQGTLATADGIDAMLAAQDAAAATAAEKLISQGLLAAEKAAVGYREYGSSTCAGYLVGFEDAEDDAGARPA